MITTVGAAQNDIITCVLRDLQHAPAFSAGNGVTLHKGELELLHISHHDKPHNRPHIYHVFSSPRPCLSYLVLLYMGQCCQMAFSRFTVSILVPAIKNPRLMARYLLTFLNAMNQGQGI